MSLCNFPRTLHPPYAESNAMQRQIFESINNQFKSNLLQNFSFKMYSSSLRHLMHYVNVFDSLSGGVSCQGSWRYSHRISLRRKDDKADLDLHSLKWKIWSLICSFFLTRNAIFTFIYQRGTVQFKSSINFFSSYIYVVCAGLMIVINLILLLGTYLKQVRKHLRLLKSSIYFL